MRYFRALALGLAFSSVAVPAMAQLSSGGMNSPTGGGPAPQPQALPPDIAPPALPGASAAPVATGPVMQQPQTGDSTTALFDAITKGDTGAAQIALGRGADLSAKNQFGETPLDLSIALNRTGITFLLLQTRNELSAQGAGSEPMGAPWSLDEKAPEGKAAVPAASPVVPKPLPHQTIQGGTGTPNPQAGFLGFGPKS